MNFASDNWAGAMEPVMASLQRHSVGFAPAYGADPLTLKVQEKFSDIFEKQVEVFFVATGSAANGLVLSSFTRPGGVFLCHEAAHVQVDECGAPEFLTGGAKMVSVPGHDGKITPDDLHNAMQRFPDGNVNSGQLAGVSITQATECGTLYTLYEIRKIAAIAKARALPVHMDGARFANALASLGCSPADMTWKSGVDVLSFGATKNGCWCAEAVVFFNPQDALQFKYFQKRAGHVFSKSRFVAAQFDGYLENDNWLSAAGHANTMAGLLAEGIVAAGGRLACPVQANEIFPVISTQKVHELEEAGAIFHEWPVETISPDVVVGKDEKVLRLVTSFATTKQSVDQFIDVLKQVK